MARRAIAPAAVAVLLSAGGCASGAAGPAPAPSVPPSSLSATMTRTATGVSWSYVMRNRGTDPLVVYNGALSDTDGAPHGAPPVWVTPRDDGTVEVAQRLLPPPESAPVTRPVLTGGSVIAGRDTQQGTVEVPLPLTVHHPYAEDFPLPLRLPAGARQVVFCLGVARQSEVIAEPVAAPAGMPTPSPRYAHIGVGADRQHLVCAPPQDIPADLP
jgi:hypothetical protein